MRTVCRAECGTYPSPYLQEPSSQFWQMVVFLFHSVTLLGLKNLYVASQIFSLMCKNLYSGCAGICQARGDSDISYGKIQIRNRS